jgi:hypothetical protein
MHAAVPGVLNSSGDRSPPRLGDDDSGALGGMPGSTNRHPDQAEPPKI